MRKLVFFCLLTVAVAVASFTLARHYAFQSLPSKAPFTAEVYSKAYDLNTENGRIVENFHTFARRADGSTVQVNKDPKDKKPLVRMVRLPREGRELMISDVVRKVSTIFKNKQGILQAMGHQAVDATCGPNQYDPRVWNVGSPNRHLGLEVVTMVADHSGVRNEVWKAPALDCYELKTIHDWKNPQNGGLVSRSEMTAVSIVLGDPAPELFEVPGDYLEKSPSLISEEIARYLGHEISTLSDKARDALAEIDHMYYSSLEFKR